MKKKKRRTGWIWILVLILGAAAFYKFYYLPKMLEAVAAVQYSEYTVSRGTVSVTVTGSGLLEAADEKSETVVGGLKILSAEAKEGDRIEPGTALYTLDPDTVEERILAVSQTLADSRSSFSRYKDYDAVTAPGIGRLKVLYAKPGDLCADVTLANGCLAVLSADEFMALELVTKEAVKPGDAVKVSYAQGGRTVSENGTVEALTPNGCTVVFPDTLALPGVTATVLWNGITLGSAPAYIHMPLYVYNTEGAIKSVNAQVNTTVNYGTKIYILAEDVATDSYRQAVREREENAKELLELLQYRRDPVIRAKNAGTLASLALSENAVTEKDVSIATVHTGGAVKMTVDIDETDIPGLELGQEAEVTLDAYPNDPFPAKVTRLPVIGVQSGTITVYKAELTLSDDPRLLEGMHGSAVITLETHKGVLTVPVAVTEEDEKGAYVLMTGPEGAVRRDVKTGISDGTTAEITEGISEGDVLLYVPRGGTDMVTKMMTRSQQRMSGRIGG